MRLILPRGLKPQKLVLRGFWEFECREAVDVSDIEKARVLTRKKLVGPEEGKLWWKQVKQLIRDGLMTRELEALITGGGLKWADANFNRVVNTGLDNILDVGLASQTRYVGLTDEAPVTTAAGDTMASHVGWNEATPYSETVRQTYTDAGVSSQQVTNSASKATFSINATDTVGGGFLTTDNTKGGTAGTLISVEAFTEGDRSVVNGDTVQVTITYTIADT